MNQVENNLAFPLRFDAAQRAIREMHGPGGGKQPLLRRRAAANEDWTVFAGGVLILDVNGEGRDDVVWNDRSVTNRSYVALARSPN